MFCANPCHHNRVQHTAHTEEVERRTRSQLSSRKCRPLYFSNLQSSETRISLKPSQWAQRKGTHHSLGSSGPLKRTGSLSVILREWYLQRSGWWTSSSHLGETYTNPTKSDSGLQQRRDGQRKETHQ